jgi:hypothetical protein
VTTRLAAFIVLAQALLSAQSGQLRPEAPTGILAGRVVDPNGAPIAGAVVGAEVRAIPLQFVAGRRQADAPVRPLTDDRTTVTDADGRYAFAGLPGGRFTVTAEKAGHPRMSYGARRPFRAGAGVFLQEGQRADPST